MKPEARLEKQLVDGVKMLGGLIFKLQFIGRRGAPDRIVIMPGGRIYLVEMKAPEGRLSKLQARLHRLLSYYSIDVYVLWDAEQVGIFLKAITRD